MEKPGFHAIEMALSKKIKSVTALELQKALDEQVRIQFNADETPNLNHLWLQNDTDTTIPIPLLTVSYDMGWQKRSSGHAYNSRSGHGLIIGKTPRKYLTMKLKVNIVLNVKENIPQIKMNMIVYTISVEPQSQWKYML